MKPIQVQFLGSGDAFGSGGRLQTCILVKTTTNTFLVDCGATALIAMRRFGVNPNDIDLILLTHLHGDHFGGIPFFVLDAQLISKRRRPLVIAGSRGYGEKNYSRDGSLFSWLLSDATSLPTRHTRVSA